MDKIENEIPINTKVVIDFRGVMTVVDNISAIVGFEPKRVFSINNVPPGTTRGDHSHHNCTQAIVVTSGIVIVHADDGINHNDFVFRPGEGLIIPPGIWSRQTFRVPNSSVIVFCDQQYDANDYIHDEQFMEWQERFCYYAKTQESFLDKSLNLLEKFKINSQVASK